MYYFYIIITIEIIIINLFHYYYNIIIIILIIIIIVIIMMIIIVVIFIIVIVAGVNYALFRGAKRTLVIFSGLLTNKMGFPRKIRKLGPSYTKENQTYKTGLHAFFFSFSL